MILLKFVQCFMVTSAFEKNFGIVLTAGSFQKKNATFSDSSVRVTVNTKGLKCKKHSPSGEVAKTTEQVQLFSQPWVQNPVFPGN